MSTDQAYTSTATQSVPGAAGGSGTVTSVTFTGDGIIDSATPSTAVTTSGTVTATALTQTANTVLAGPTSGSAAAPSFRALAAADMPTLLASPYGGTTAGTATAQTITVPNIPATPTAGTKISFLSGFASTGTTTLNVTPTGGSAYGALPFRKRATSGVVEFGASGDLTSGGAYEAMLDGSATEWVLTTPSSVAMIGGALTAHVILVGNSNNQLGGAANVSLDATNGFFGKINGETLAGFGVPYVRGVTSQKAETGTADASVLSVTPAATVGTYRVSVAASVSSATSGVIGFTVSWTDSNGNAQSNIAVSLFQLGTAAPANTFTTSAAGNYSGSIVIDTNTAAAAILTKWVGGGTSAAKVSAIVERLQ